MEPIDDPVLGHLEFNAQFGHWVGETEIVPGKRIEITLEDDELEKILPIARAGLTWFRANEPEARRQLALQMLERADDWRQEGDAEITEGTFAERVRLTHILLLANGETELRYSDGEMFGGHTIVVAVGADRVLGAAYLWG
jgi:hypothetical protein